MEMQGLHRPAGLLAVLVLCGFVADRPALAADGSALSNGQSGQTSPSWHVNLVEITLFAVSALRVHTGPGRDFPVVTNMVRGQSARVTGVVGDHSWYQVALTNDGRGYVHGDLLGKRPAMVAKPRPATVAKPRKTMPQLPDGVVQLPPPGQGTPAQERLRKALVEKVRSVYSEFDNERLVLAAMQQRMKQQTALMHVSRPLESRSGLDNRTAPPPADRWALDHRQRLRVLDYYEQNGPELLDQLTDYNKRVRLAVDRDSHDVTIRRINSFDIESVQGDHVRVRMGFELAAAQGRERATESISFTMKWTGNRLHLVSHSDD